MLELLSSKYKIGIIANQAEGTASRLNKHGLMKFISLCYSSTEVGLSKPDILFFKKALEEASCKPEMAVMVGDRLDNDIKPANILNMWTIRILQGNAKHQESTEDIYKPDFEINNIEDILNILI